MHKGINSTLDEGQTPVISIHPHCIGRAPEAGPQGKEYLLDGSAYCMDSRGQPQAVAQPMVLMDQGGSVMNVEHDMVGTLRRETHGHEPAVIQPPSMQVRRLTPVECERLQGFPDGYTNIPWRKKDESPDGPRYKALGNSWAVPVVRWIGERIAKTA
jgi:DNA (cytosine-5)-methyltransferase 1